ncbi:glycoside hydrolase family 38 C-terminal domain-containing protein [Arsenicitalea aurantiaca]|nr:alpha-mannosidase [Arsenicitalea aurantiaca]
MPKLHLIGNAHLDPVWLWRWQEGCAEAIGTCWAAIDRLEEGEGFVFTKGEALIYLWIERYEPALFERIAHYVREGRWKIVNGWWIQPDCNVPSGESVIRQALYGKRYFAEKFGVEVPTGYNVDSFGHPNTFPMLLAHTGSTTYTFMRPGPHEMDLPGELFTWASPDGSEVTAFRIQDAYNTSKRSTPLPEKIDAHYAHQARHGHDFMCFYGVGNHGGAPTIENIEEIENRIRAGEALEFSHPEKFFAEVDTSALPRVESALQFHAIGCYAVASSLKTLNRKAESILEQAESAAAIAHLAAGVPYPREEFEELWRILLFNQFHDTLGGTSLESACVDSERDLAGVIADAEILLNAAVRRLDGTISAPRDPLDATFVVMNFAATPIDTLLEAEPWVDKDVTTPRSLLDETGASLPFQYIDPHGKTTGLQRIAFRIAVPAFGYRVLRFAADAETGLLPPPVGFGRPHDGDLLFETPAYRLRLDPETGAIAELIDRANGMTILTGGHEAIIVDDPTDTWSHGIDRFGMTGTRMTLEAVTLLEDGPVRKSLVVTARHGASVLETQIVLPADPALPVELRVRLDWREKRHLLRLAYPVAGTAFDYEMPAGFDTHPDDGREIAGQRWVRASRAEGAVAIVNDAKYSYAAEDGTLFITAVRAPVYAHHDPIPLEPGAHYTHMDQGPQRFTVWLKAGPALTRTDAARLADALNKPLVTTPHVARGGTLPHAGRWLPADAEGGILTTLKAAEDGAGLVLRAIDLEGAGGTIAVAGASLPIPARGLLTARLAEGLSASDGLER